MNKKTSESFPMTTEIIKKKRGRKPKQQISEKLNIVSESKINSEDENIILYLPITTSDINNDIFMPVNDEKEKDTYTEDSPEYSNSLSNTYDKNTFINTNISKVITRKINITPNTKCWWCKNCFDWEGLQLPEQYYLDIFYCMGNFCSFGCMKAYNFDLNDYLTSKRNNLISIMYYTMYSKYDNTIPAPHWLTLTDFGGHLTIDQFRDSEINSTVHNILWPPIVSRQLQIEESYRDTKKNISYSKLVNSESIHNNKCELQKIFK